jgi:hypothetical protein
VKLTAAKVKAQHQNGGGQRSNGSSKRKHRRASAKAVRGTHLRVVASAVAAKMKSSGNRYQWRWQRKRKRHDGKRKSSEKAAISAAITYRRRNGIPVRNQLKMWRRNGSAGVIWRGVGGSGAARRAARPAL